MIILNPLYNRAFDELMANEGFVLFFISIVMRRKAANPVLVHKGCPYPFDKDGRSLLVGRYSQRFVYTLDITHYDGQTQEIMVEILKGHDLEDMDMLEEYLTYEREPDAKMPWYCIGVFFFNMPDMPYALLDASDMLHLSRVNRRIKEQKWWGKRVVEQNYWIQVGRLDIKNTVSDPLGELLLLFQQNGFDPSSGSNQTKTYPKEPVSEGVKIGLDILADLAKLPLDTADEDALLESTLLMEKHVDFLYKKNKEDSKLGVMDKNDAVF